METPLLEANEKFHLIPCPVCCSTELRDHFSIPYGRLKQRASVDYEPIGIFKETVLHVKRCPACDFVFVNPRIRPEFQGMVYNECKPGSRGDASGVPQITVRKGLSRAMPVLEAALHLGDPARSPHLLDFGCGFGEAMALANAIGFRSVGVDIDVRRVKHCRDQGLEAYQPDELLRARPDFRADVIICQSNLEHLVDLPEAMDFFRKHAAPGCLLYLDGLTPRLIQLERGTGHFIKAHFIEHINYFHVRTLDRLARKYGFIPEPQHRMFFVRSWGEMLRSFASFFLFRKSDGVLGRLRNRIGERLSGGFIRRVYKFREV